MSAAIAPHMREALGAALGEILGVDVPDRVSAAWVASAFGIDRQTVGHAVRVGKLPAEVVTTKNGKPAYSVRPGDALLVWGHRLLTSSTEGNQP